MSEVNNVVEGEFTEVQEPQAGASDGQNTEPQVAAEITISVMSDGQINLNVNEQYQKLESAQIEGLVKSVYEQLHDSRIADQALQLLKARLA